MRNKTQEKWLHQCTENNEYSFNLLDLATKRSCKNTLGCKGHHHCRPITRLLSQRTYRINSTLCTMEYHRRTRRWIKPIRIYQKISDAHIALNEIFTSHKKTSSASDLKEKLNAVDPNLQEPNPDLQEHKKFRVVFQIYKRNSRNFETTRGTQEISKLQEELKNYKTENKSVFAASWYAAPPWTWGSGQPHGLPCFRQTRRPE